MFRDRMARIAMLFDPAVLRSWDSSTRPPEALSERSPASESKYKLAVSCVRSFLLLHETADDRIPPSTVSRTCTGYIEAYRTYFGDDRSIQVLAFRLILDCCLVPHRDLLGRLRGYFRQFCYDLPTEPTISAVAKLAFHDPDFIGSHVDAGGSRGFGEHLATYMSCASIGDWRKRLNEHLNNDSTDFDRTIAELLTGDFIECENYPLSVCMTLCFVGKPVTSEVVAEVANGWRKGHLVDPVDRLICGLLIGNRSVVMENAFEASGLDEIFAAHFADLATLKISPMTDFAEPESLRRTALTRFCDFLLAATNRPIRSAIGSYLKVLWPPASARLLQRMGPFLGLAPAERFRAEGAIGARTAVAVRAAIDRDVQENDERYTNTQMWLNDEFLSLGLGDKRRVIDECRDIIGKVDGLEPRVLVAMEQAHLGDDDEVVRDRLNKMVFRRMTETGEIPGLFVDKT